MSLVVPVMFSTSSGTSSCVSSGDGASGSQCQWWYVLDVLVVVPLVE